MAEKVILARQDGLHMKFRHPRVRKEDLDFQVLRDLRATVVEKVHLVVQVCDSVLILSIFVTSLV